jgi:hypothetical protein
VPLDVLDDDDRVVDDDTGGEDDAEQRQGVDGEAHHLDERERPDQRDRNGDCRDQRAAPRLQEHEDDQHHQADRFDQRRQHFADRRFDDVGGVECDLVADAWRERSGEAIELRDDGSLDVEGVRGRQLRDAEANRLEAAEPQIRGVGFSTELGATDVGEADQRAVVATLEDDVVELARLG